jgi:hypothetical protein
VRVGLRLVALWLGVLSLALVVTGALGTALVVAALALGAALLAVRVPALHRGHRFRWGGEDDGGPGGTRRGPRGPGPACPAIDWDAFDAARAGWERRATPAAGQRGAPTIRSRPERLAA